MNPFRFLPRKFFTILLFILVPAVIGYMIHEDGAIRDCPQVEDLDDAKDCLRKADEELERFSRDAMRNVKQLEEVAR